MKADCPRRAHREGLSTNLYCIWNFPGNSVHLMLVAVRGGTMSERRATPVWPSYLKNAERPTKKFRSKFIQHFAERSDWFLFIVYFQ